MNGETDTHACPHPADGRTYPQQPAGGRGRSEVVDVVKKLACVFGYLVFLGALPAAGGPPNPYEEYFWRFVNGVEVRSSYSQALRAKATAALSPRAREIHEKALAVYDNPANEHAKLEYLTAFPRTFDEFLAVFHAPAFDQLYDGSIYIHLLKALSDEYPAEATSIFVGLVRTACFDADAPNYLRDAMLEFRRTHRDSYMQAFDTLTKAEQDTAAAYFGASLHSRAGTTGLCPRGSP